MLVLVCMAATGGSALLVRRMIRLAVLDVPGHRSAHDRPVAKGGGVGAVAALLGGLPAILALHPDRSRIVPAALLLAALLLLAAVSWLDDVRQFGYRAKLAAQFATSLLAATAAALSPGPAGFALPWLAMLLPASLAWLLLVTNAANFMDGLNGLVGGAVALLGLFVAGLGALLGDVVLLGAGLMATCGLLGFLPYNYPRARIFLGDVGSQPCGLLAGAAALLVLADAHADGIVLVVPLMLAGILWDVLFTLARRFLAGERVTEAHRGHLYQVAARSFMKPAAVAAVHWGFVAWGGGVGLVVAPGRPAAAILAGLVPQLAWTVLVRHRATRAGLERWS